MRWLLPLACAAAGSLHAQYALSAMAGYIHHAEGEVWLGERAIEPKPQDFEHMLEGRRLRTGRGRAEILLVPGSFLRVGEQSEIEMISSGLAGADVRLVSGSLVVDLQTLFEKDSIAILAGGSETRFRKTGMYRLDAGGSPALEVEKGRALVVAGDEEIEVKSGQSLALGTSKSPEKSAKAPPDALDSWNAERHQKIAILEERAREKRWDGMSEAERELLTMILRGPSGSAMSDRRPISAPPPSQPSRR